MKFIKSWIEKNKNNIKENGKGVMAICLIALYPCMYMYLSNILETHFYKMLYPLFVFAMAGIAFSLLVQIFYKNYHKSAVAGCAFVFFFTNYNLMYKEINKQINAFKYLHLTIIVLAIMAVIMTVIKKINIESILVEVISIVAVALIAVNVVMAIPDFMKLNKEVHAVELESKGNTDKFDGNVYYFMLDEYGGEENLEYYFDYSNEEFLGGLEEKGFSVSNSSYNSEALFTMDLLPNILNFEYVAKPGSLQAGNYEYYVNPAMYRLFKNMGYQVNLVNHQNFLDNEGTNVLFESEKKNLRAAAKDIDNYLFDNSVVTAAYQLIKSKVKNSSDYSGYRQELLDIFDLLEHAYEYTDDKPTLTVSYIMCPHRPFVFGANGEDTSDNHPYDWKRDNAYIDQLKYVNKRMEGIIDSIKEHDPNSIIILQSDHGARYSYFNMYDYEENEYDEKLESEKMQNILNAVYIGDENLKVDVEGLSAINTWRSVLNTVFDTDMDMIYPEKNYCYKWKYKSEQQ